MIQDDLIVQLGQSQQKVMSLTVEKRALRDGRGRDGPRS
jgi:hypothetical protein